jgi:hypothetical protein
VFHANIRDRHPHQVEAFRDSRHPFIAPEGRKTLGHSFVQSGGRHFNGMRYPVHILNRDSAGSDGHGQENIIFAFCSPYRKPSHETVLRVLPLVAFDEDWP